MDDDDILLDKITARLRTERVPEVPTELLVSNATPRSRVTVPYRLVIGSLAASLMAFLFWSSWAKPELSLRGKNAPEVARSSPESEPPEIKNTKVDSDVVLLDVDLTEPLNQLAAELVLLDAQIDKLRSQAALLDARRLADEMIVQN